PSRKSFAGTKETELPGLVHRRTGREQTEPDASLAVGEDRLAGLVREVGFFLELRHGFAVPRHHAPERRAQPQRVLRVGGEAHDAARTSHFRNGNVFESLPDEPADLLRAG